LSFQDYIISILSAAAVSSVFVGILIWLTREWISARLKGSIQHEYDQKLEAYKAQLKAENEVAILDLKTTIEREAALHAAARASFSEGQKAAMERKLSAVDRLWGKVLYLRSILPPILTFIDVLTVDEYRGAKDDPTFQELSGKLSIEEITNMVENVNSQIENVRPYVGEYMWAIFFSYQAIMLRILVLLHLGRDDAAKIEWHKDPGVRHLMEAVLKKEELDEFDTRQFGKISWLRLRLDSKILNASSKIISGEEFGEEALKQAMLIQQRVAQLETENKT
jgi:hypothetical protein